MKKVILLLLIAVIGTHIPCMATDHNSSDLLSLLSFKPGTATQNEISNLLGKPGRTEEGKKRTVWYYERETTTLAISWNSKSAQMEKFSFSSEPSEKTIFDKRLSRQLKSGATDIAQAIKILGTPKDMTIKGLTQEMHYKYQNNVLRLFFRNKLLVDYCLY